MDNKIVELNNARWEPQKLFTIDQILLIEFQLDAVFQSLDEFYNTFIRIHAKYQQDYKRSINEAGYNRLYSPDSSLKSLGYNWYQSHLINPHFSRYKYVSKFEGYSYAELSNLHRQIELYAPALKMRCLEGDLKKYYSDLQKLNYEGLQQYLNMSKISSDSWHYEKSEFDPSTTSNLTTKHVDNALDCTHRHEIKESHLSDSQNELYSNPDLFTLAAITALCFGQVEGVNAHKIFSNPEKVIVHFEKYETKYMSKSNLQKMLYWHEILQNPTKNLKSKASNKSLQTCTYWIIQTLSGKKKYGFKSYDGIENKLLPAHREFKELEPEQVYEKMLNFILSLNQRTAKLSENRLKEAFDEACHFCPLTE